MKMRKVDLCLSSEGAEVILATSSDEKHPPENMIDGNPETFWTTTGMFPQEFIICFHKHVRIERLVIQSYFVRTLRIEKSTSKEPVDFEQWIERDLVHMEGQLQNEEIMEKRYKPTEGKPHAREFSDPAETGEQSTPPPRSCVGLFKKPSLPLRRGGGLLRSPELRPPTPAPSAAVSLRRRGPAQRRWRGSASRISSFRLLGGTGTCA